MKRAAPDRATRDATTHTANDNALSEGVQASSLALPEALGRAQYETQCAVVELLTHGATWALRSRILNAESALGSARWIVDYVLAEGAP